MILFVFRELNESLQKEKNKLKEVEQRLKVQYCRLTWLGAFTHSLFSLVAGGRGESESEG